MAQSSEDNFDIPAAPEGPPPAPDFVFHAAGQEDFLNELENCSVAQIQQKTAKIRAENLTLSIKVTTNKEEIAKLIEGMPKHNESLAEYNNKKMTLNQQAKSLMRSYKPSDPEFTEAQEDLKPYMEKVAELTQKAQSIKSIIELAQTKITQLETENKALEEEQGKNRAKIATANAKITSMGGQVAAALPIADAKKGLLAELEKRFNHNVEYTNLTHYCYKADGTYGDLPLNRIRKKMVEISHQSITDVRPYQIIEFLKHKIQDGSLDTAAIKQIIGFDPVAAQDNRRKTNASKVNVLSNLENYAIDKDGKPSTQTLPLLKTWFSEFLGYDVEDDTFAQVFRKDIEEGRVTPAMINVAINFNLEEALEKRQASGMHFSVQDKDSPKAQPKPPQRDATAGVRRPPPPPK